MESFIRVVEVWVPDVERAHLQWGGGLYGNAPSFGANSRNQVFSRGEGLPGHAWETGAPVVLTQFEGSYFRRTAAAAAAGLTCGIAVPIFAGDFLTAVLVFFCGDDGEQAAAIELWHAAPAKSHDMKLVDGYYGKMAEAFEVQSRNTAFRIGNGLPGRVWQSGAPVFMEDLGKSNRFLRADTATRVGISRGLGVPLSSAGDDVHVGVFLSALGTPISRRFEIWTPDRSREYLLRTDGFCEHAGRLVRSTPEMLIERGQGAIGRVALSGVPAISEHAVAELGKYGTEIEAAGLHSMVALPLIRQGRLTAIVVWYF